MRHELTTVTLIERSSAYNPDKVFAGQAVEIHHVPDIVKTGVDGKTSYARQDLTIIWYGGKDKDLKVITHVKIVGGDGGLLIDEWPLNRNFVAPHDVAKGVEFCVLRPDDPSHCRE